MHEQDKDIRLDTKAGKKSNVQQYLTFKMGNDEFGVDILSVQEIHGWIEPRSLPDTPKYIKGVLDWRGAVVPLVDLRIRFGYESVTYNKTTVVIILKSQSSTLNKEFIIGIVVDAVSDVYDVAADSLKVSPDFGSKIDTRYIQGIAKINDSMIIILDLSKLIQLDQL